MPQMPLPGPSESVVAIAEVEQANNALAAAADINTPVVAP